MSVHHAVAVSSSEQQLAWRQKILKMYGSVCWVCALEVGDGGGRTRTFTYTQSQCLQSLASEMESRSLLLAFFLKRFFNFSNRGLKHQTASRGRGTSRRIFWSFGRLPLLPDVVVVAVVIITIAIIITLITTDWLPLHPLKTMAAGDCNRQKERESLHWCNSTTTASSSALLSLCLKLQCLAPFHCHFYHPSSGI